MSASPAAAAGSVSDSGYAWLASWFVQGSGSKPTPKQKVKRVRLPGVDNDARTNSLQHPGKGLANVPREILVMILLEAAVSESNTNLKLDHIGVLRSLSLVCQRFRSVVTTKPFFKEYVTRITDKLRGSYTVIARPVKLYVKIAPADMAAVVVYKDNLFIANGAGNAFPKTIHVLKTARPDVKYRDLHLPQHNTTRDTKILSLRPCAYNDSLYICTYLPSKKHIFRVFRAHALLLKFRMAFAIFHIRWAIDCMSIDQRNGNIVIVDVSSRVYIFDEDGILQQVIDSPSFSDSRQLMAVLVLPDDPDAAAVDADGEDADVELTSGRYFASRFYVDKARSTLGSIARRITTSVGLRQKVSGIFTVTFVIDRTGVGAKVENNRAIIAKPVCSLLAATGPKELVVMAVTKNNTCSLVQLVNQSTFRPERAPCNLLCDLKPLDDNQLYPITICYDVPSKELWMIGNEGLFRAKPFIDIPE